MSEIKTIPVNKAYTQIKTTGGEIRLDYTFPVLLDGYILVNDIDDKGNTYTLIEGVDYDLFGIGNETGGYIQLKGDKYINGAPANHIFNLIQNVPEKRSTDFQQQGDFFARDLNQELDLQIQIDQQLRRDVDRAIKVALGAEVDLNLPAPDSGKALVWNQAGDALTNSSINVDDTIEEVTQLKDQAVEAAASASASEASAASSKDTALTAATSAEHYAEVTQQYAINAAYGNVGDIKYTARKNVPAGGKWCDGTQYAATDTDCARIYQMLVDGDLESVSFTVFNQTVTDSGSCGFFGLDTATQSFKVPKLNDIYLKAGNTPLMFGAQSLPEITGSIDVAALGSNASGAFKFGVRHASGVQNNGGPLEGGALEFSAADSNPIYQNNADVNPEHVTYRAYVVIYASELDIDVAEAEAARDAAIAAKNEAADSATAASGSATQAAASATAAAQSAEEAQNQVLPDQTGQDGKYLTTNNGTPAWGALDLNSKADTDLENITATGKANILALQKLDWDNRVQILTNDGSTAIEQGYTPPSSGVLQHFTRAAGSRAMGIYKGNTISNDKVLYYFRSDDSSLSFYYGLIEVEGGEPYWLQGNPNSEEICFIPYLGA